MLRLRWTSSKEKTWDTLSKTLYFVLGVQKGQPKDNWGDTSFQNHLPWQCQTLLHIRFQNSCRTMTRSTRQRQGTQHCNHHSYRHCNRCWFRMVSTWAMLRLEWLLCCHCPVCIYFMFAILRLNKPHLQPSGNADERRGWNDRGCGRGSHTCSRTLFVSCCTSGATNHRSNLAWIWHQMFLRIPRQMSIWQLFIQILFITIN